MARTGGQNGPAIVWFRDDLRLADNPALTAAARSGRPILALYILDEGGDRRPLGGASRWWLHHSLAALTADLAAAGVPLVLRRGAPEAILPALMAETGAAEVHWNRRYGPAERALDSALKAQAESAGLVAASHNGSLLVEPWTVTTKAGGWCKVFTPFWKAAQPQLERLREPLPVPAMTGYAGATSDDLATWRLRPTRPDWSGGLAETWIPGEAGARARLARFLDHGLSRYADQRDVPAADATSALSPHLRFGEISAVTAYHAARRHGDAHGISERAVAKFQSELGWREFSYNLLFHFPDLGWRNVQQKFDAFPWTDGSDAVLTAWRRGETGYPIVDAGMRQLWRTGTMHNRVRMIVASFLVKHLLVHWRVGEAWFWDTLCDADPANNAASWQWVAGSGADAAPYFRIFNPVGQGEKFDPDGTYVRTYLPELSGLPADGIHRPWELSEAALRNRGVVLGRTYPRPIVDLDRARTRALEAFDRLAQEPRVA